MRHVRAMAGIPSSSSSSHSSPGPHPSWSRNSLGPGVVGAGGGKGAPSRKLVEEARLSLFVTDENKLSIPGGKGGGGGGGGEVKKRPQSTMMGKVPIEELEVFFSFSFLFLFFFLFLFLTFFFTLIRMILIQVISITLIMPLEFIEKNLKNQLLR